MAGKEQRELTLKFLLCGDKRVGKGSVVWRYCEETSPPKVSWESPYRSRKKSKTIQVGKTAIRLQVGIDDKEDERYDVHPNYFYRNFGKYNGFMVVYDITDADSPYRTSHWIESVIRMYCMENCPIILVGNKCDLEEDREVDKSRAMVLAASLEVPFLEVSAKTGENVDKAFSELLKLALEYTGRGYIWKYSLDPAAGAHGIMSRAAALEEENVRMVSIIKSSPKKIKVTTTHAKDANKRAKSYEKRANALLKQIEKDAKRFESAVHRREESRGRADMLEQRERVLQNRVSNLQVRVQQVEGRVAALERQLRRAKGEERGQSERNDNSWVIQKEEIVLTEEELGRGHWATVCVAKFRGLKVAAKCMHNLIISEYNRQLFSREMSIAATARHPNLIQFIGATVDGQPIILLELMFASLRAELERQPLSPDQISSISLDVARALLYLHLMQPDPIIHRDISSANVLLNPGPGNSWVAKVSDYGSANYVRQVTTQCPGNPSYAAPEANIPSQQSPKMDVYSYGALLLEMWSRQFPDKAKHHALLQGLEREEVREMAQRCLEQDPLQRPDMRAIVEQL